MDRSSVITLISKSYTVDSIGQKIPTETETDVFCSVSSITQTEFFEAGRQGLKAEYKVTMFEPEYSGQEIAKLNGTRYGVYRTFRKQNEEIELYLERKSGV